MAGKHTYGLIGFPLGHSFSAGYFAEKFIALGLEREYRYLNFPVQDSTQLRTILPEDIEGFNVTIPHKENMLALLAEIDPTAREIGAVNCVKVLPDGGWKGYNTDAYGFEESLRGMLRRSEKPAGTLKALVLGTGGAAKAVCYVLNKLEIEYIKVSRSADPGNGCISYGGLTPETVSNHRLIINTTPLGMAPDFLTEKPEISYEAIGEGHYMYDLIYNPGETAFLREGRKRRAWIKNGLEMLFRQAERSWEIWNGLYG